MSAGHVSAWHPAASYPEGDHLLVIVDPAARSLDGESVRVARDVLGASAPVKLVIPEDAEEVEHALAHRGRKRPVVIGDDSALRQVIEVLNRRGELDRVPVALVPVGRAEALRTALALGLPQQPAPAARTALGHGRRTLDLLTDDTGRVVLRSVRIGQTSPPPGRGPAAAAGGAGAARRAGAAATARPGPRRRIAAFPVLRAARRDAGGHTARRFGAADRRGDTPPALLVRADERLLPSAPRLVTLSPALSAGRMDVLVHGADGAEPSRLRALRVSITGEPFRCESDSVPGEPTSDRTWTLRPEGWHLIVP